MTHVSVKSEFILSSKRCPNFREGGYVCNRTIVRSFVLQEELDKADTDKRESYKITHHRKGDYVGNGTYTTCLSCEPTSG